MALRATRLENEFTAAIMKKVPARGDIDSPPVSLLTSGDALALSLPK